MARYRKVDSRIWNDAKFRALSDNGKLVFFFLLTHPHMTALGAFRGTIAGLTEELGWKPEAFREAFREGCAKGMIEHDQKACLIALPNFLKYNPPEIPNVVKAWTTALDLLPECGLKSVAIQRAKAFTEGMTEAFGKAFTEALPKAMPNQEQEQEPEQEQEKSKADARRASSRAFAPPTLEEVTRYCEERGNLVDPKQWFDYYTSNGWMVGRNRMRDWRAAVRTWEKNGYGRNGKPQGNQQPQRQPSATVARWDNNWAERERARAAMVGSAAGYGDRQAPRLGAGNPHLLDGEVEKLQ